VVDIHNRQLADEVAAYERLRQGEVGEVLNLHGLGRMLVGLRVSLGLSQRELAGRLGIHESQVSRDERNEYHGITVERASRVLDALGVTVSTKSAGLVPGARPLGGRQSKAG
jgi:transcriptional regulator with XRE-family HTH domain